MKCIILSAGYGTRLYPLTLKNPKSLLKIKGKSILKRIIQKVEEVKEVNEIFITTNSKFKEVFSSWFKKNKDIFNKKLTLYKNLSKDDKKLTSPITDVVEILNKYFIKEDLLIIAGDNLFDFSLKEAMDFFKKYSKPVNVVFNLKNKKDASRFGVVKLKGNRVISFEEKPKNPRSNLISIGVYFFPKKYLRGIREFGKKSLPEMNIGHLIKHFFDTQEVYAFKTSGHFIDIGVPEDYERAKRVWKW